MMAIRAQSQDRGEQSLLELRRLQPAGVPSREVVGDNQPSMDAKKEIARARAPVPRERPSGERRIVEAPPGDGPRGSLLRRRPFTFLIGLILFVVATTGGYLYWNYTRHFESTDDAFVAARQFPIAPKVSGYITAVPVTDNQHLATGDVIARIDQRDYLTALDQT
jgi:membrane fusion protein (multidrug efflux system)